MEDALLKSLEHAPALLAMVIIVMAFLKFLKHLLTSHAETTSQFAKTISEMSREHAEARSRFTEAMERNINATAVNTAQLTIMNNTMSNVCKADKRLHP